MKCDKVQVALNAYVDKELSSVQVQEIEAHLHSCANCGDSYRELTQLKAAIKSSNIRDSAPTHLRKRVSDTIREHKQEPHRRFGNLTWLAYSFPALVLGMAIGWAAVSHLNALQIQDIQTQSLVSAHVRSLMADHLIDIASSDSHTVKPWFHGRLDFSPPVEDLTQYGYPLLGGRLDYVAEQLAAALVYRHRQHKINLFISPKSRITIKKDSTEYNGYNIIHWDDGHLSYWAVSDLNRTDLEHFKELLNGKASPE